MVVLLMMLILANTDDAFKLVQLSINNTLSLR
jgi:hypothetical protein